MADTKVSALATENTAPAGTDLIYTVPTGAPIGSKECAGSFNLLPSGYVVNGKISVTVASNNITVALKTLSGGNPSATDPVSVWINGSYRRCTAALSVTKNAGTNWFASGSAELATNEIDYFVYLIWNTTPATDIVDLGFARIPYGRVYSDFSGTTTNEKYLAFANASTPTSTDDCVVIGRFAATLSATSAFNWSVPTFTNINLIQTPIYKTRRLSWLPIYTGFTGSVTTTAAKYQIINGNMLTETNFQGTSNATGMTFTLPFTTSFASNTFLYARCLDNSNGVAGMLSPSSATVTCYSSAAGATWTASGTKGVHGSTHIYPLT